MKIVLLFSTSITTYNRLFFLATSFQNNVLHWGAKLTRPNPPKKQPGIPTGPRSLDGAIMGVKETAEWLGTRQGEEVKEGTVRARAKLGLLPYRKWGGRIIFIKSELERFFRDLPGVTTEEALNRLNERNK